MLIPASLTLKIVAATMKAKISSTPVALAMIVTALVSLFILIGQNQMDRIIHGDLYSYGLTFSYLWATPYWVYSALVIGFSWFSIIASIAITIHAFKGRTHYPPLSTEAEEEVYGGQREQRRIAEYAEELEQKQEGVSEALIASTPLHVMIRKTGQPASLLTKRYDVRHPRDVVDSQC